MASCVRNILVKNYQNPIIGFKVTVKNVGDVFETQCTYDLHHNFGRSQTLEKFNPQLISHNSNTGSF